MKRVRRVCFLVALLASSTVADSKRLAWLGMGVRPLRENSGRRVLHIDRVTPDGPAAHAGLHAGDIITDFGGGALQIGDDLDFLLFVGDHKPGDRIAETYVRYGAVARATLTFGVMPEAARPSWYQGLDIARRKRIAARPPR